MKNYLIIFLSFLILSSCQKNKGEAEAVSAVSFAPPVVEEALEYKPEALQRSLNDEADKSNSFPTALDTSRKIIKTGDLTFEARDLKSTRQKIMSAAKELGGYVSEEKESGFENERKEITLSLKIPASKFDKLLDKISSTAGKIDSKNISIEDITSNYVDTKTRLENKKKLEQRYLQLLQKSAKISDMLQIENKLSEIRTEIESVERQFLQMQKQVAYSSLTVSFYSRLIDEETKQGFVYQVKSSVFEGFNLLGKLFHGLLSIWPLILVLIMAIFISRNKIFKRTS